MDTLSDIFLTTLWLFFLFAYLMILFNIFSDLFRDPDISGPATAAWIVVLIFLPLVSSLVYVLTRGSGMRERSAREVAAVRRAQDEYIRSVAGTGTGPAAQIEQAHVLLDKGAISREEFEQIKAKALA